MTLLELKPIWKEVMACFEALRRLGFSSDDLYMSRAPDGRLGMLVRSENYLLIANPPGENAFAFKGRPDDEIEKEWREAASLWNAAAADDKAEVRSLWESSSIYRQGVFLAMDLKRHGILIPAAADA